jgi:hypothetical protein
MNREKTEQVIHSIEMDRECFDMNRFIHECKTPSCLAGHIASVSGLLDADGDFHFEAEKVNQALGRWKLAHFLEIQDWDLTSALNTLMFQQYSDALEYGVPEDLLDRLSIAEMSHDNEAEAEAVINILRWMLERDAELHPQAKVDPDEDGEGDEEEEELVLV